MPEAAAAPIYKPASCGVHETVNGRPCQWCPSVLTFLRLNALNKEPRMRKYVRPETQVAGAPPGNMRKRRPRF